MIAIVRKIEPGAQYDGVTWDYWLDLGINGVRGDLKVFDGDARSHVLKEGQRIDVRVGALFVEKENKEGLFEMKGVLMKDREGYFLKNDFLEIYLKETDVENILPSQEVTLFLGRLDVKELIAN